jgi:hypothetical protein
MEENTLFLNSALPVVTMRPGGISFKMLASQFVGIAIRSVRGQVKQFEIITQSFDEALAQKMV